MSRDFAQISKIAGEECVTSGEKTANFQCLTGPGVLTSFHVCTDGTNNAKLVLDDSVGGGGTVVREITVVGNQHYGGVVFQHPIPVTNGIYATITGTGASYFVEHIQK